MWAVVVVIMAPVPQLPPRIGQRKEDLYIQTFVP
jgi:hypothetical protein